MTRSQEASSGAEQEEEGDEREYVEGVDEPLHRIHVAIGKRMDPAQLDGKTPGVQDRPDARLRR